MPYIIANHINQASYTHYSPFKLWKLTTLHFDRWSLTLVFHLSPAVFLGFLCANSSEQAFSMYDVNRLELCLSSVASHSLTFMEEIPIRINNIRMISRSYRHSKHIPREGSKSLLEGNWIGAKCEEFMGISTLATIGNFLHRNFYSKFHSEPK